MGEAQGAPLLRLERAAPASALVRWRVSAAAWAGLDAEFPPGVGVTHPLLRLRLVRRNGSVQEVASQDLASTGAVRQGAAVIPVAVNGEYEAELGLASDDGGWLLLGRSERRRFGGLAPETSACPGEGPGGRVGSPGPGRGPAAPPVAAGMPSRSGTAGPAVAPLPDAWGLLADAAGGSAERAGAGGPAAPAAEPIVPAKAVDGAEPPRPNFGQGPAAAGYAARPEPGAAPEVRAELLVYGCGPPGSRLDLYGRTLHVGPGGAFSLRLPLSDPELLRRLLAEPSAPVPPRDEDG